MENEISSCGIICSECEYYPKDCPGCKGIEGKPFWIQFVEQDVCKIYDCCLNKKKIAHCGKCQDLPCSYWFDTVDPNLTPEEREMCLQKQLKKLRSL